MTVRKVRSKYIFYDENGKVIIITSNRRVGEEYVRNKATRETVRGD